MFMYLWSFFSGAYLNQHLSTVPGCPRLVRCVCGIASGINAKILSDKIKSIRLSADGDKVPFRGDKNILELVLIVL